MSNEFSSHEEYQDIKQANEALDYLYNGKRETKRWSLNPSPNYAALNELSKIMESLDFDTSNESDENIIEHKVKEISEENGDKELSDTPVNQQTKSNYAFCQLDSEYIDLKKKFEGFDNKRLINILVNSSDKSINYSNPYVNRRIDRLTSSIILNERGIAPEFRDAKSGVTHRASESAAEMEESNDRQMIDMHWLYLNHQKDIKPTLWMKDLFVRSYFDFKEAEEFVASARYTKIKIQRLGIPKDIQKLLLTLRSPEILKFQKEKREELKNLEQVLTDRSRNPRSRLNEDDEKQNIMAFRCLLYAELSVHQAMVYWNIAPTEITSKVTQQLKPWIKSRLKLLKVMQISEKVKI